MKDMELRSIFYRQNKDVPEYMDIFFDTSIGIIGVYGLKFVPKGHDSLQSTHRLNELDDLKVKYGTLYVTEIRGTYDNNLYLLISGRFILAIEYILNSNFQNSIQEFRIIEDLDEANKTEFNDFKELDTVELPSSIDPPIDPFVILAR